MARGRTSLVARSLLGSNRRNERPAVHVDNQAPGGDYRWSGVRKKGKILLNKGEGPGVCRLAFNDPGRFLRFTAVEHRKQD